MKTSEMLKKITSTNSKTGELFIDGNKIAQVLAELDEKASRI